MLISFSVGNFLSFKDIQTLDMNPDALKEHKDYLHVPYLYNFEARLLKSVGIYGYNSHGKTNFLKAYRFLIDFVFGSFSLSKAEQSINFDNFKLNSYSKNLPTHFEVVFFIKNKKYRYGFKITKEQILEEWLYYAEAKVRENYLFHRLEGETKISKTWNKESNNKIDQLLLFTKPHHLLLSILITQQGIEEIEAIQKWFKGNIIITDIVEEAHLKRAILIIAQLQYRSIVNKFIEAADLGFTNILEKIDSNLDKKIRVDKELLDIWYSDELKDYSLYSYHDVYDEKYNKIDRILMEMTKNESAGTNKYFIVICYMAYAIKHGFLLLIDELDSQFHAELLKFLIKMFNSAKINNIGGQMIFTTHNTVLMNNKILRRDQIVLVEKNEFGESSLRRMHTAKTPLRADSPIEKDYMSGDLGGTSKKVIQLLNKPGLFDLENE